MQPAEHGGVVGQPVQQALQQAGLHDQGHGQGSAWLFGMLTFRSIVSGLTTFLYYVLPNFADFDVITRTAHGEKISGLLFTANSLYALLYVTVLISAAVLVFEEKEFR